MHLSASCLSNPCWARLDRSISTKSTGLSPVVRAAHALGHPKSAGCVRYVIAAKTTQFPFFFKQWGGLTPKQGGNLLDGRQWMEYPASIFRERNRSPFGRLAPHGITRRQGLPCRVGPWVREKLDCLRKYLHAYTTVLSKQRFQGYFNIDAFAGPGSLKLRREQITDPGQKVLFEISEHALDDAGIAEYISGSPRVALDLAHPFTDYVFIELDSHRFRHLQLLGNEIRARRSLRIHLRKQDCNDCLLAFLERMRGNWKTWPRNRLPGSVRHASAMEYSRQTREDRGD